MLTLIESWSNDTVALTETALVLPNQPPGLNFSKIGLRLGTSTWLTPSQPQSLCGRMMLGILEEPMRLFHLWPQREICLHHLYGLRYHPPCGGWRKGALERTRLGRSMTVLIESWGCWAWVTACLCPDCWRWGAAAANRSQLHLCLYLLYDMWLLPGCLCDFCMCLCRKGLLFVILLMSFLM